MDYLSLHTRILRGLIFVHSRPAPAKFKPSLPRTYRQCLWIFACVAGSATAKTNKLPNFDYIVTASLLWLCAQASKGDIWYDNFKGIKTFCKFIGSVCFTSWRKTCAGAILPLVEHDWLTWLLAMTSAICKKTSGQSLGIWFKIYAQALVFNSGNAGTKPPTPCQHNLNAILISRVDTKRNILRGARCFRWKKTKFNCYWG